LIFYLSVRSAWEVATADVLAAPGAEGFVHCCDESQIGYVRRRFFPADADVVAIAFDPTQLPAETRYEPGSEGEPERFPHVYGELPRTLAVFARDA